MDNVNFNPLEVIEKLNVVISIQSEVINELFELLMQHITADEADTLPVVDKINRVAMIRAELGL